MKLVFPTDWSPTRTTSDIIEMYFYKGNHSLLFSFLKIYCGNNASKERRKYCEQNSFGLQQGFWSAYPHEPINIAVYRG